jgi:hypothetical protein
VILEYLRPEPQVYANARVHLDRVVALFKFKKNEIKKATEKKFFWKMLYENEAAQSQLGDDDVVEIDRDADELRDMVKKFGLDKSDEAPREIGSVNPLEDFTRMITWKKDDLVVNALM